MQDVFDAGVAWVVSNATAISDELKIQAAKGVSSFTLTLDVAFEPTNLKIKGTHMNTFFAGIQKAMADEQMYSYDVTPVLNEGDTNQLKINLVFTL
jgi:hypothetical protein